MPTASPPSILIVEDDRDILEALRLILVAKGYKVTALDGAGQLLPHLEAQLPDLVLLDIWVGDSDGRDIARMLRRESRTAHIPIVLVSANLATPQIAKELRVDDFVLKPFDIDHLLTVIERRLKAGRVEK